MNRLVLTVFTVLLVLSCGKDEQLTKADLLSASPWVLTSKVYNPPMVLEEIGSITDYYQFMAPCFKDDQLEFQKSGVYVWNEGATKCSSQDPGVFEMGVWAFGDNETTLHMGIIDFFQTYNILKLTGSELQILQTIVTEEEGTFTVTDTYKHP